MKTTVNGKPDARTGPGRAIDRCPVCDALPAPLYSIDRFREPFAIQRCPNCGLQMQTVLPADPDAYYDRDYYTGRAEYNYRDERRRLPFEGRVWRARLKRIARHRPPPADFLDVGCAFGGFVAAAGAMGYRARGLDVSKYAVEAGRATGLDLKTGALEPGVYPANSFDVVTLVEVFEHLADPRAACRTLADILRPGGLCLIQTANFDGRQARSAGRDYHYYLPGHLFYYSARNLKELLAQHGFSRVIVHRPVDFGLLPKLLKSRGDFRRLRDYLKWARIAWYHGKGMVAWGDFALTSSMVLYAFRD